MLMISIPCEYSNNILTIKSLGFKGKGNSPDEAILECIKNSVYYVPFLLSKFKTYTDHRHIDRMHLEVPFDSLIYDKITQIEPLPGDTRIKKSKSSIILPTDEQILKLGY